MGGRRLLKDHPSEERAPVRKTSSFGATIGVRRMPTVDVLAIRLARIDYLLDSTALKRRAREAPSSATRSRNFNRNGNLKPTKD